MSDKSWDSPSVSMASFLCHVRLWSVTWAPAAFPSASALAVFHSEVGSGLKIERIVTYLENKI